MNPLPNRPEHVVSNELRTASAEQFKNRRLKYDKNVRLGCSFQPSSMDVICGRGKRTYEHAGNKIFRSVCSMYLEKYQRSSGRVQKSSIMMKIVEQIRRNSPTKTGFVRQDPHTLVWYIVRDHLARDKVGHSFRDIMKARKKALEESELSHINEEFRLKRNALIQRQREIFAMLLEEDEKACSFSKEATK